MLFQPFVLGMTDATSLVASKSPENVANQDLDEDEDRAPTKSKKCRKIPKLKSSARKEVSKFCKFMCCMNSYRS